VVLVHLPEGFHSILSAVTASLHARGKEEYLAAIHMRLLNVTCT
jgi:hypothetical protein